MRVVDDGEAYRDAHAEQPRRVRVADEGGLSSSPLSRVPLDSWIVGVGITVGHDDPDVLASYSPIHTLLPVWPPRSAD